MAGACAVKLLVPHMNVASGFLDEAATTIVALMNSMQEHILLQQHGCCILYKLAALSPAVPAEAPSWLSSAITAVAQAATAHASTVPAIGVLSAAALQCLQLPVPDPAVAVVRQQAVAASQLVPP